MDDLIRQIAQRIQQQRPQELDPEARARFFNWMAAGAPDISEFNPGSVADAAAFAGPSLGGAAADAVTPTLGGIAGDEEMRRRQALQAEALRRAMGG